MAAFDDGMFPPVKGGSPERRLVAVAGQVMLKFNSLREFFEPGHAAHSRGSAATPSAAPGKSGGALVRAHALQIIRPALSFANWRNLPPTPRRNLHWQARACRFADALIPRVRQGDPHSASDPSLISTLAKMPVMALRAQRLLICAKVLRLNWQASSL